MPFSISHRQRKDVPGIQAGQLFHSQAAHADESSAADTQGQDEVAPHLGCDHHSVPHLLDALLRNDDYVHVPQSRQKGELGRGCKQEVGFKGLASFWPEVSGC